MILLLIDNQPVNLQSDFNFKFTSENVYFTAASSYTFDIHLSLKDEINAKIFNHINIRDFEKKKIRFDAKLYIEAKLILSGIAVVTNITDDLLSLQLLGGNSSTNFIMKLENTYLDEINITATRKVSSTNSYERNALYTYGPFPETNWVQYPVITSDGDIFNNVIISYDYKIFPTMGGFLKNNVDFSRNRISQPYLLHVINSVCKFLGLTIVENDLLTSPFKDIAIFNRVLPHWTIQQFIDEVERFCTVIFDIDDVTNNVRIKFRETYFNSRPVESIEVVDSYEVEVNEEETTDISNADLTFALPYEDKLLRIDPERYSSIPKKEYNSVDEMKTDVENNTNLYSLNKYIIKVGERDFVIQNGEIVEVNLLSDLNRGKGGEKMALNIVPARITPIQVEFARLYYGSSERDGYSKETIDTLIIPAVQIEDTIDYIPSSVRERTYSAATTKDAVTLIQEDVEKKNTSSVMLVALVSGIKEPCRSVDGTKTYYMFTSYVNYIAPQRKTGIIPYHFSLMLKNVEPYQSLYSYFSRIKKIDTTRLFHMKFIADKMMNTNCIYNIHGKLYVPLRFEYKISNKGKDKLVDGFFYPYAIE